MSISMSTPVVQARYPFSPHANSTSSSTAQIESVYAASGISPVESRLVNGASGSFVQTPMLRRSTLQIILPLPASSIGAATLLKMALFHGSSEQERRIEALRAQGSDFSITEQLADQLVVQVSAAPGQEGPVFREALSLVLKPDIRPDGLKRTARQGAAALRYAGLNAENIVTNGAEVRLFGPSHPFGIPINTQAACLEQYTPEALMAYHRQVVQAPAQTRVMMISPVAPVAQQAIVNQAVQSVGWYPPATLAQMPVSTAVPPVLRGNMGIATVPNPSGERAWIQANWKFPPPGDADYPAVMVLTKLLQGMGTTSPGSFNALLRTQHGLTYGITAGLTPDARLADGSLTSLRFDVDFANVGQAIRDVNTVVSQMRQLPIPSLVLDGAKRSVILGTRLQAQSEQGLSDFYQPWMMFGQPLPDKAKLQEALSRVTPTDIQRVADRIFNTANGQAFQLITVSAPPQILQRWFPGSAMAQPVYR